MAWLWFLPALYLITVFSTPLFLLAEQYNSSRKDVQRRYCVVAFALWGSLAVCLLLCGFSPNFAFFSLLGPLSAVVVSHVVPLPIPATAAVAGNALSEPRTSALEMWLAYQIYTLIQGWANASTNPTACRGEGPGGLKHRPRLELRVRADRSAQSRWGAQSTSCHPVLCLVLELLHSRVLRAKMGRGQRSRAGSALQLVVDVAQVASRLRHAVDRHDEHASWGRGDRALYLSHILSELRRRCWFRSCVCIRHVGIHRSLHGVVPGILR
mmetsp:Transcript_114810/g.364827  ORF Transcript_114810/g.364827 Transcript_114810/m.364827 type:complete len:268 (+) Transcript_114810:581-1384(+)